MSGRRALLVTSLGLSGGAIAGRWLAVGNEIAEIWYRESSGISGRERRMARYAPRWSVLYHARRHGIALRPVSRLATWDGAAEAARASGADVLISAHFHYVVPPDVLAVFGERAVNFHPALLPRYRGPIPVVAMIANGEFATEAGVTAHVMTAGLDEGPIIARRRLDDPLSLDSFALALAVARAETDLLCGPVADYLDGRLEPFAQDEAQASYFRLEDIDSTGLGRHFDAKETEWRCRFFSTGPGTRVEGGKIVFGFGGRIGPPSGAPLLRRGGAIEFDCADARVRAYVKRPWTRQWNRIRNTWRLMRAPAP
ncbi:MAG: formyltransferase family protein [Flavobacteriaceae bacterium]